MTNAKKHGYLSRLIAAVYHGSLVVATAAHDHRHDELVSECDGDRRLMEEWEWECTTGETLGFVRNVSEAGTQLSLSLSLGLGASLFFPRQRELRL